MPVGKADFYFHVDGAQSSHLGAWSRAGENGANDGDRAKPCDKDRLERIYRTVEVPVGR